MRGGPDLPTWLAIASLAMMLLLGSASLLGFGSIEALDTTILIAIRHAAESGGAGWTALRSTMLSATAIGAFPTLAVVLLAASGLLIRSIDARPPSG